MIAGVISDIPGFRPPLNDTWAGGGIRGSERWIPAFAGMTDRGGRLFVLTIAGGARRPGKHRAGRAETRWPGPWRDSKKRPGFSSVLNPDSAFTTAVPWGISRGMNLGGFGNRYGVPSANEVR